MIYAIGFLSFVTDGLWLTVQTQISLSLVYTVCNTSCIFWKQDSLVQPFCSENLRKLWYLFLCHKVITFGQLSSSDVSFEQTGQSIKSHEKITCLLLLILTSIT